MRGETASAHTLSCIHTYYIGCNPPSSQKHFNETRKVELCVETHEDERDGAKNKIRNKIETRLEHTRLSILVSFSAIFYFIFVARLFMTKFVVAS